MHLRRAQCLAASAFLLLSPSFAPEAFAQPLPAPSASSSAVVSSLLPHRQAGWMRAKVVRVDTANRSLWLETADGLLQLQAGDTLQRLDQVKAGDLIEAQYELGLALSIAPPTGIRERETLASSGRADAGPPSGSGFIEETLRVEVLEVDAPAAAVRVRGASGRIGWVRVLDDAILSQASPGKELVIRYRLAAVVGFRALPR